MRALELFCARAGIDTLSLPVRAIGALHEALAAIRPDVVVVAGSGTGRGRGSLDLRRPFGDDRAPGRLLLPSPLVSDAIARRLALGVGQRGPARTGGDAAGAQRRGRAQRSGERARVRRCSSAIRSRAPRPDGLADLHAVPAIALADLDRVGASSAARPRGDRRPAPGGRRSGPARQLGERRGVGGGSAPVSTTPPARRPGKYPKPPCVRTRSASPRPRPPMVPVSTPDVAGLVSCAFVPMRLLSGPSTSGPRTAAQHVRRALARPWPGPVRDLPFPLGVLGRQRAARRGRRRGRSGDPRRARARSASSCTSPTSSGSSRAFVSGRARARRRAARRAGAARPLRRRVSSSARELAAPRRAGACASRAADALRPPPVPESELRPRGRRHSLRRDRAAVRHHYDVSNAFYRRLLGPSLVYSCAYFDDPDDTLDARRSASSS